MIVAMTKLLPRQIFFTIISCLAAYALLGIGILLAGGGLTLLVHTLPFSFFGCLIYYAWCDYCLLCLVIFSNIDPDDDPGDDEPDQEPLPDRGGFFILMNFVSKM